MMMMTMRLTLTLTIPVAGLRLSLGGDPVAVEGKVAGVDEVLEGGEALDQVALEGVVRQQAQRRQAVDATGGRGLKEVEKNKVVED